MKIFLKTLKYLGYSIVGFIVFLLLYLLSAAVLSRIADQYGRSLTEGRDHLVAVQWGTYRYCYACQE